MQCRNHGFQGFPLSCVGQFQNAARLYSSQEGQVVDNSDSSRGVATNARVRQGCVLIPIFFLRVFFNGRWQIGDDGLQLLILRFCD